MGGVSLAQPLINAGFCEQDVLVQKRRQKKGMRIESQPVERKRAEGNEHQQHDFMEDVLESAIPLSGGAVMQVKDLESS